MNHGDSSHSPYVACLTPPGSAAIATLALAGHDASALLQRLLGTNLPATCRFSLRRLGQGAFSDEVVVACKSPAHFEIHCHGGVEVVRFLMDLLREQGAVPCSWQDMTRLLHADPWHAEASIALADAKTPRTAAILLDQLQSFGPAMTKLREALERDDLAEAESILAGLLRYEELGRHLTQPWRVAILGAPNVGKSSLVNALAGYERSVVSPTPGTTRDAVATLLAIDGWPVETIDTAGLRDSHEVLEAAGMDRARSAAQAADLCVWVLDASAEPVHPDFNHPRMLTIANKCDLPPAWKVPDDMLRVSAKTGEGLDRLMNEMSRRLVPDVPPPGTAVPFTTSICDELRGIDAHVRAGRTAETLSALAAFLVGSSPSAE